MSKAQLKSYLNDLQVDALREQILDLYDRFKPVKEFYDFAFNPKEDKLVAEAKFKIGKEYFPPSGRKPKKRRSVAQKFIRNFMKLEMNPELVLDVMLFHIEVAQTLDMEIPLKQDAFHKAMLKAFEEAVAYKDLHGIRGEFTERTERIAEYAAKAAWPNREGYWRILGQ